MARLKTSKQLASRTSTILDRTGKPMIRASISEGANPFSDQYQRSGVIYGKGYSQDYDELVTPPDRMELMGVGRYMYSNLGIIKSICWEMANYSVGDAFIPEFTGKDEEWGKLAKDYLLDWGYKCDVKSSTYDLWTDLKLMSVSLDRDGDCLIILTEQPYTGIPQIQMIGAHRIGSRDNQTEIESGKFAGRRIVDGVIFNKYSRVVGYQILGDTKDDDIQVSTMEAFLILEPEFISQGRGIPSLSSGIVDLREYRVIRNFEKMALKNLSSRAVIEHNELGGVDVSDEEMFPQLSTPSSTSSGPGVYGEYINGGTTQYFRANSGADLKAFEFNRPNPNVSEFLNEQVLRQICNSVGLPLELVWNPTKLGGASVRLTLGKAQRKINQRQSVLYKAFLRIINYALAKAITMEELPFSEEWSKWSVTYPPKLSVDEGRDMNAELNSLKSGTTTYSEIYGRTGFDWKTQIDQRITEEKYIQEKCKEAGLDSALVFAKSPNPVPTVEVEDEDESEEDEPANGSEGTEDKE